MVMPSICEHTPSIMTARGLTGKRSTLRTDSLEAEYFFSRVQPPTYVNPSEEFYVPELQPNHRLVKRHKLNTCDSLAQGTRSTSISELLPSSGRKVDYFFTKIKRYKITSEDISKNQNESDRRSPESFKKLDFSSMDPMKGQEDLALSHPWIQRWRHSQPEAQAVKPVARVIRKPQIPKAMLKKQLPSFAAVALMGRALNRFRPCEFRISGSVTCWNSKGL